jgi:L-fuculose-phosphate aldolase
VREPELRKLLTEICHRMYRQGYIAAGDGNVSAKLDDERVLVTPTGYHKGFIKEDDLVIVDLHGKLLRGTKKPSSEFLMHELAYAERADVGAVVHAHPPITVALALAGVSLAQCILSETCLILGAILVAPYSTPTTEEVPRVLKPYMRQSNAIVMDRHGAITLGRNLDEAYNRLEAMEHAAKITHAARVLGPVKPLPPREVDKLQALAKQLGIPRAPDPCTLCNACPNGTGGPGTLPDSATSVAGSATSGSGGNGEDAIVDAVLRRLRSQS